MVYLTERAFGAVSKVMHDTACVHRQVLDSSGQYAGPPSIILVIWAGEHCLGRVLSSVSLKNEIPSSFGTFDFFLFCPYLW